jgi:hypothetical protein
MTAMNNRLLFLLACAAAGVCALAQPALEPLQHPDVPTAEWENRGGTPPFDSACLPAPMDRHRKMLEAVRISRMTEALDLSEDQIASFFPRLKKMEEALRSFDRQRDDLTTSLEKALTGQPSDAELKTKIDQLDKIEEQKLRRLLAGRAELDALLSISQRARLRVFNQRFEDEVRAMVRTIRERRMKHLHP